MATQTTTRTTPAARPARQAPRYSRRLTFRELTSITIALSAAMTRLHEEMFTTMDGYDNPEAWNQLRTAAEALHGITDHVCNDSRWNDGDGKEPASAAPSPTMAQASQQAGTTQREPRVHRTIIDRLQALRSEFAEHPDDIDILLDLVRAGGEGQHTAQEAVPS